MGLRLRACDAKALWRKCAAICRRAYPKTSSSQLSNLACLLAPRHDHASCKDPTVGETPHFFVCDDLAWSQEAPKKLLGLGAVRFGLRLYGFRL